MYHFVIGLLYGALYGTRYPHIHFQMIFHATVSCVSTHQIAPIWLPLCCRCCVLLNPIIQHLWKRLVLWRECRILEILNLINIQDLTFLRIYGFDYFRYQKYKKFLPKTINMCSTWAVNHPLNTLICKKSTHVNISVLNKVENT